MRRLLLVTLVLLAFPAKAIDTFIIDDIRVEGLQRVAPGAVFVALTVRVGDEMNDQASSQSIQALFATGFFHDVRLYRDGDTLIVSVVERPTISAVAYDGNRKLKDEAIEDALKVAGLAAGDVFNPELLRNFTDELKKSYFEIGHFSAEIYPSVSPLSRNRVELELTIVEGKIALIKEIDIVGNEQIDDKEILEAMKLSTKKTLGFLNRNNRYSREQLRADLESITNLYLNRGFIEFQLTSSRTFITENLKDIKVVIMLTEGEQYEFGELSIASSEEVMPQEQLDSLVEEPEDNVYSFEQVSKTRNAISEEFSNLGYGRAQVDALPTIHDDDRIIDVNYVVNPGKLTYVRTITFTGNYSTADEVLRREMRILESGQYTAEQITQSRNRLQRLGIFSSVDIELIPVPGTDDQVDLVVTVEERLTGTLLFGVGYSESEKAAFNFSVSQSNLFGTGKKLSLKTSYGKIEKELDIEYVNPYYTVDGVSRGFDFGYRKRDTSESDSALVYSVDFLSAGVDFLYPVSEEGVFGISFSGNNQEILIPASLKPTTDYQVYSSVEDEPKRTSGNLVLSYRKDTRDRAFFATRGADLYLALTSSFGDEQYFGLRASYAHFFPLGEKLTLRLSSQADVASNDIPFYRNYYMTGSAEMRGFTSGELGARQLCRGATRGTHIPNGQNETGNEYRRTSDNKLLAKKYSSDGDWFYPCNSSRSLGGNFRVINRAELFFPFLGADDTHDKRISLFVDHGYTFLREDGVYGTASLELGTREDVKFSNFRSSVGLGFEWLSPIGPFGIHYAIPIEKKPGDQTDKFQITLGTFF